MRLAKFGRQYVMIGSSRLLCFALIYCSSKTAYQRTACIAVSSEHSASVPTARVCGQLSCLAFFQHLRVCSSPHASRLQLAYQPTTFRRAPQYT